jgi:hypothetical protein
MRNFESLSEREILALAIALEEEVSWKMNCMWMDIMGAIHASERRFGDTGRHKRGCQ